MTRQTRVSDSAGPISSSILGLVWFHVNHKTSDTPCQDINRRIERDAGLGLVTNEIPCGLSLLIGDSRKLDEDMIDMMQTIIFLPVQ